MHSRSCDDSLARTFSSSLLSAPAERPSTPPSPEVPLSPSAASSFITLTPPSPNLAAQTTYCPIGHIPAPPSSPTKPEQRGRKRQRSPSPPASPSLRFGRLRLSSPEPSPSHSRSRSCSPPRDQSPTRPRSRSPPADRPLTTLSDYQFTFTISPDPTIDSSDYWQEMEQEQQRWEIEQMMEDFACPPDCNCHTLLREAPGVEMISCSISWDDFRNSIQFCRE